MGYCYYVDDVVICFVECVYESGVDVFRIFDVMNDIRNLKIVIKVIIDSGVYV